MSYGVEPEAMTGVVGGASVYGVRASVYGVGASVYGYGSLVILVSAQGPNPSFFYSTFIQLGGLLGPGFGPGLDNR